MCAASFGTDLVLRISRIGSKSKGLFSFLLCFFDCDAGLGLSIAEKMITENHT